MRSRAVLNKGTKPKSGCLTSLLMGAKRGRTCYVTVAFLGFPKQGDKMSGGCLTIAIPWGPKGLI